MHRTVRPTAYLPVDVAHHMAAGELAEAPVDHLEAAWRPAEHAEQGAEPVDEVPAGARGQPGVCTIAQRSPRSRGGGS